MSLIPSVRLNGHDPYAYLKDVLTRLPSYCHTVGARLITQGVLGARISRPFGQPSQGI